MKKMLLCLLGALVVTVLQSCGREAHPVKIKYEGQAQGTYYALTYYAADTVLSQAQVDSILDAFDRCASIYEPSSIISGFNRNDSLTRADSLFRLIYEASLKVAEATGGAFDVTVGQLVNAWGFGFKNRADVTPAMVDSLLQLTGYRKLRLEGDVLVKADPRIMLDFNAIAQGFSVDLMASVLEEKGVKDYLIDIGGEVRGSGKKPDGTSWVVGIEKPAQERNAAQQIKAKVHLDGRSLATSGNYRKYYEKDGLRYSHTIDPSTGYPVRHNLLSVSVAAADCMTADAYATAFMVMGLDKTQAFLAARPELKLEVYCIFSAPGGQLKTWNTAGFSNIILEEME